MTALDLRPAGDRLDAVERLLASENLPTDDVREKPDCFHLARRDGRPVGVGGLEVLGTDALLRSVVVSEHARGEGVGTAVCDALATRAADRGVERLYLLTTSAEGFFTDRGYEQVDRTAVPERVRETTQFASLCPATATAMCRTL